ncbi:MAG: hypothetical protein KKD86_02585 [Bacteroidetes bacterium]|nr:hypothetical protein [Bacteroidota bacterium]MBU1677737.1 hypothetical protein [Bacteroidota bacterium]
MINYKTLIPKLIRKENYVVYILILAALIFGSIEYGVKTIGIAVIVFYSMYTIITNMIDWFLEFLNWIKKRKNETSLFRKYYSFISSIIVLILLFILDEKIRSYLLIFCGTLLVGLLIIYLIRMKLTPGE